MIGFGNIRKVAEEEIPCEKLMYDLNLMTFLELEEKEKGIDWFTIDAMIIVKFLLTR